MAWRLAEIEDTDATEGDLTDSELIGISIILAQYSEPDDVYRRAWTIIQPKVEKAISH